MERARTLNGKLNKTNRMLSAQDVLEAAMWWSREFAERRKETLAQRPHIKEALAKQRRSLRK